MKRTQQQELNRHLLTAIQSQDLKEVMRLIEDIDINEAIHDSRTCLHWASMYDNIEMVEALISAGADVNVLDRNEMTPLEWAIELVNQIIRTAPSKLNLIKDRIERSKILIQYIVISDFYEIKPDCVSNNAELSQFWDECSSQVEKMQDNIGGSTISWYRLLRETDKNKLAGYLSNKDIGVQEELEKAQYVKSFSIYASMIEEQLSEGKKRLCLLRESHIAMSHYDFTDLPEEIKSKISALLTNIALFIIVRKVHKKAESTA